MFTGIVEELGRVAAVTPNRGALRLRIACDVVLGDAERGSSIAVNGCCLTVVALGDSWWEADVQPETVSRTTMGSLKDGDPVNLERPLRMGDRVNGHLVQGHVDGVGTVEAVEPLVDGSARMRVRGPARVVRYVVEKGSVAVDGVSLTVTEVDDPGADHRTGLAFGVALVPHTLAVTTLGVRRPRDRVNLEADVVAKYVERFVWLGRREWGA
jgi:riboflavin synthase